MQTWRRTLRHLWLDAGDARRALTPSGLKRLEEAVRQSEIHHRGELRLCVEASLPLPLLWRGMSARQRAIEVFSRLRVWDTAQNNGVLIYLLLADRRIEIIADRGLSEHVSKAQWQAMADTLGTQLAQGAFEQGMRGAIAEVDALLRQHFPAHQHELDVNELPDAVVLM
ncbi:TPM domain-containing protein [Aquabacterium sp.]|uniref:TPM domain-containing protein n=1 Tax=Aquabacterium sp. TaxID=1872578 RepID=UPI0035B2A801